MAIDDTINLLKECDAGSKMAVSSIDEIIDRIRDSRLAGLLRDTKRHHQELGNEIHALLLRNHSEESEPNPMAKGMSWFKTNFKMGMDESDATVADLITDGCNMGIKSLYRYLNEYSEADHQSKDLCRRLVKIEEQLCEDLRCYL